MQIIAASQIYAMAATILLAPSLISARPSTFLRPRASGYQNPTNLGGSMLTETDSATGGLGEPLNVIISGDSDAQVLTSAGIEEYFESLYYSPGSCLGITLGGPQTANVDGNGYTNQTLEMRFNYYQGDGGSCLESLHGGNHLRYWNQSSTGAYFVATSYEFNATLQHDIVNNGYDLGRNLLVGNATNSSGTTSPGGFKYSTTNTTASLLSGVKASQLNHDIAVDGNVAILTVRVTQNGTLGANRNSGTSGGTSSSSSSSSSSSINSINVIQIATALLASFVVAGVSLVL